MNTLIIPLVSICCETFNHKPYVKDALEGFLMQKTNFAFEVLIHDDASTDGTQDVIKEYVEKYPHIIKPIYQKENQYSKGIGIWNTYQFPRARGRYIALCEGDDYWTDPLKLQKQVDFLEANPDYSMCFSSFKTVDIDNTELEIDGYKELIEMSYANNDILKLIKGNYILTCTVVLRSHIFFSQEYSMSKYKLDYSLFLSAAWNGRLKFFEESMSAYRIVQTGMVRSNISYVALACNHIQRHFFQLWNDGKYERFKYRDVVKIDWYITNKLIGQLLIFKKEASVVRDILMIFKNCKRLWVYIPPAMLGWLYKICSWQKKRLQ